VNFRTIFSSSVKNVVGIWTGIILNLQVTLNRMDILTVLIPIIHC
jgi:cation transporter-like permease